jgi:hypothetical protein
MARRKRSPASCGSTRRSSSISSGPAASSRSCSGSCSQGDRDWCDPRAGRGLRRPNGLPISLARPANRWPAGGSCPAVTAGRWLSGGDSRRVRGIPSPSDAGSFTRSVRRSDASSTKEGDFVVSTLATGFASAPARGEPRASSRSCDHAARARRACPRAAARRPQPLTPGMTLAEADVDPIGFLDAVNRIEGRYQMRFPRNG